MPWASAYQQHPCGTCMQSASGKPIASTWPHCGGQGCRQILHLAGGSAGFSVLQPLLTAWTCPTRLDSTALTTTSLCSYRDGVFCWWRRGLAVCSKHYANSWVGRLQRGSCSWGHVFRRAGCQHGHAWQVSKMLLLGGIRPAFANSSLGWLWPKASLALGRLASCTFLYLQGSHLAVFVIYVL